MSLPQDYRPKIIVTKIGLDGHDRGSRIIATMLRDAGMEVVYTPPWQSISDVVRLAEDEDADVIGISSLATDHLLIPDLLDALRKSELEHIGVIVGGIIPEDDEVELIELGVRRVFHPGSSLTEISSYVRALAFEVRTGSLKKWEIQNHEKR
ncbi:MAG: cobalamin-dependent protein [Acidiferrobacterales bacterium]|nr:cobalamin-dependent protein [Acidiferrobacterales bacterium]